MDFRDLIQDGIIDLATWLIITKEDSETINSALNSVKEDERPSSKRTLDAVLAIRHETIHFFHAISTNFLFSYSCNYLHACLDIIKLIRNEGVELEEIQNFGYQDFFGELKSILLSSDSMESVRTIDVIEGSAVFCSYRGLIRGNHYTYLRHLKEYHPQQKQYTEAYNYLTKHIGELAYHLFSPICYLSLQGDNPGKNFVVITDWLIDVIQGFSNQEILKDPLSFVIWAAKMEEEGCFPTQAQLLKRDKRFSHPILNPFVDRIVNESDFRVTDFFARPYHYELSKDNSVIEFIMDVVPPLHFYSDRKLKMMGLGDKIGKDYGIVLNHLTALIGMIPKLLYGKQNRMYCQHINCPIHKSTLCNKYFVFPIDDYKKCAFPDIIKGVKLNRLINLK